MYFVDDFARVVFDAKLGRGHAWLVVERIGTVQEMALFQKREIRRLEMELKPFFKRRK